MKEIQLEKNEVDVSVIMPCYNDGKYLYDAVLSALNSTYSNIEIIIVNDGSFDNTKEVGTLLQERFQNVRYFEQENQGPAAARNYGIKQSLGEFILPLDADDKISTGYIAIAQKVLNNNNQIKVVYSEAEFFGNKNGKWDLPEFSRSLLARKNMIFCSGMYRKVDFLSCGGYSEELIGGWEDWEFWISMLKNEGEIYKIPKVHFFYRIKSLANSRRKKTNRKIKKATIDFINSKHLDFMERELHGPLRYNRSWSKGINMIYHFLGRR